jgi:hypothetical protein
MEDLVILRNIIKPWYLTDARGNQYGKICSEKLLTLKKLIQIKLNGVEIVCEWKETLKSFKITGYSNIPGWEVINWKWRRNRFDSLLTLEDLENGQCIAEFNRKRLSMKDHGKTYIYPDMPSELAKFVIFSLTYSLDKLITEDHS